MAEKVEFEDMYNNEDIINSLNHLIERTNKTIYVNVDGKVFLTKLQVKVLLNIDTKAETPAWKIAKNVGKTYDATRATYQTLSSLEDKGLIEINFNGQKGGMSARFTERGIKVRQKLIELAQEEKKIIDKEPKQYVLRKLPLLFFFEILDK